MKTVVIQVRACDANLSILRDHHTAILLDGYAIDRRVAGYVGKVVFKIQYRAVKNCSSSLDDLQL